MVEITGRITVAGNQPREHGGVISVSSIIHSNDDGARCGK